MIEKFADNLMIEVAREGKLTKEMVIRSLKAAEDEGFNIGFEEGLAEGSE